MSAKVGNNGVERIGRNRDAHEELPADRHVRRLNEFVELATKVAIAGAALFGVLRFFGSEVVDFVAFARELTEKLAK